MTTKLRKPLFERLKQGLEDGIAHVAGTMTLRTVEVPEAAPEIDGATVAALRNQAAMSQAVFASLLNVSTKTLQSWEQGVRQPSEASRRLLQVFSEEPAVLCRIAGLPEIRLTGVQTKRMADGHRKVIIVPAVTNRRTPGRTARTR